MIRIALVTVFTFLAMPLFAQDADCQDFRTGQYKIIHDTTGGSIIKRAQATQIEYNSRSNLTLKLDVNWVGDCTFVLTLDEVLKNPNDIYVPKDATFTVEIIETKADAYKQRTTSNFSENVMVTKAIRLK